MARVATFFPSRTDRPNFDQWKNLLHEDCVKRDRLLAFSVLGDYVLRVLYDSGLEPTVEAIGNSSSQVKGACE